jgi:hypothetical protein
VAEKKTLPIRDQSVCPYAGQVTAEPDLIQRWIMGTAPADIKKAGTAHTKAAELLSTHAEDLRGAAKKLSEHWRSDASAKTQQALQMLVTTSTELVTKLNMMGAALDSYGGTHLPDAQKKIQSLPKESGGSGGEENTGGGTTGAPSRDGVIGGDAGADRTKQAREILQQLNQQIVQVYYNVPVEVTYTLPEVTMPADPGGPGRYRLPTVPSTSNPLDGTSGGGSYSGGSGGLSGSSGDGGARPDTVPPSRDPGPGSPGGPDGTGPGGNGPGGNGNQPGGQQPDGQHPDGTAPPVIGGERSTAMPGVPDQRGTEAASVPPTITGAPPPMTPMTPTTVPTTPGGWPTPQGWTPAPANPVVGTPPGVPTVLGNPGTGYGAMPGGGGPGTRTAGAPGNGGFPFMPMGSGASAGAEDGYEHSTMLHEDPDTWVTDHNVTDPLIG